MWLTEAEHSRQPKPEQKGDIKRKRVDDRENIANLSDAYINNHSHYGVNKIAPLIKHTRCVMKIKEIKIPCIYIG